MRPLLPAFPIGVAAHMPVRRQFIAREIDPVKILIRSDLYPTAADIVLVSYFENFAVLAAVVDGTRETLHLSGKPLAAVAPNRAHSSSSK